MDSETFLCNLDFLGSNGVMLSVEHKACMQSSLVTLRKEQKFRRTKLWGIIKGIQKDYFIVQGIGKNELFDRKALYSQDCMDWHLLPYADSGLKFKSALLQGRFVGDPSFEYEHSVTHRTEEGDDSQEEMTAIEMKEEDRLAAVVARIDNEVAVVPRGAFMKTPLGEVVQNKSFQGLSLGDAKRLNYYYHFRASDQEDGDTNSMSRSVDFMDSIAKDIPKGCWSLQCDRGGASVVLRSLAWPGMVAYHVPNSTNYAYFYSGTGEKNPDLVFML